MCFVQITFAGFALRGLEEDSTLRGVVCWSSWRIFCGWILLIYGSVSALHLMFLVCTFFPSLGHYYLYLPSLSSSLLILECGSFLGESSEDYVNFVEDFFFFPNIIAFDLGCIHTGPPAPPPGAITDMPSQCGLPRPSLNSVEEQTLYMVLLPPTSVQISDAGLTDTPPKHENHTQGELRSMAMCSSILSTSYFFPWCCCVVTVLFL